MKVVLFKDYEPDFINCDYHGIWLNELRTDPDLIRSIEDNPEGPLVKFISGHGIPEIVDIPDESTDWVVVPDGDEYRSEDSIYYVVDGKIYRKAY